MHFVLKSKKAYGLFTPQTAHKFAHDSLVYGSDGKWRMHCDPEIIYGRKSEDSNPWGLWERISIRVLTIWGEISKLPSEASMVSMRSIGSKSEVLPAKNVEHCPGLTSCREIDAKKNF